MRWTWTCVLLTAVACGKKEEPAEPTEPEETETETETETEGPADPCGDGTCDGDENFMSCDDDCSLPPPYDGDLTGCADDLPQADIDAELGLFWEVDQDVHEMVACGALVFALIEALVDITADLAEGASELSLPVGYSWEEGTFLASPDSATRMDLAFTWGAGFDSAAEGDPITDDLFAMDSYLANPRIEVDYYNFQVLIRHDGIGPLVELLGLGTSPGRPIELGLDDLDAVAQGGRFDDLLLDGTIQVGTVRGDVDVAYEVALAPKSVGAVLSSGLDSSVRSLSATDGVRTVEADAWSITYVDDAAALDGTIGAEQSGGSLPMAATFVYDETGYADTIELSCP